MPNQGFLPQYIYGASLILLNSIFHFFSFVSVLLRCTESEIFDSNSVPASLNILRLRSDTFQSFGLRLLLKLQSQLSKLLAVSKRLHPVFALKSLKNVSN